MYIYNLPHAERKELCRILDQNNKWEDLAGTHMQYDVLTIQVRNQQNITNVHFCKAHFVSGAAS